MRATLGIEDDVLLAAKEKAKVATLELADRLRDDQP